LCRVRLQAITMIEYSCTLRRSSSRGLCAHFSCFPTPPSSRYSPLYNDNNYCDGCCMHIASLLHRRSQIRRQRIESAIDNSKLALEVLSAACCILEKLSNQFYSRVALSLSDPSILGEVVLISAFMISSKYLEDETPGLRTWAKVCGQSLANGDLRFTEMQILTELDFGISRIVTLEAVEGTICEFRSRQFCIDFLRPTQISLLQSHSPVKDTAGQTATVYSCDYVASYSPVYDSSDDEDEQLVTASAYSPDAY
ncbi:hypothetical protein V1525DRAFT_340100, partial [Lipomyces kononenkoae]